MPLCWRPEWSDTGKLTQAATPRSSSRIDESIVADTDGEEGLNASDSPSTTSENEPVNTDDDVQQN